MIADLPPVHPIVVFAERVEYELGRIPGLQGRVAPLNKIRISTDPIPGYTQATADNAVASTDHNNSITLYQRGRDSIVPSLYWLARAKHRSFSRIQPLSRLGVVLEFDRTGPRTMSESQQAAFATLVHETLHRLARSGVSYAEMTTAQRSINEGVTETLAYDLVPVLAWRLWKVRVDDIGNSYPDCVGPVREYSRRATKAPRTRAGWTSPGARRARVRLALLPIDQAQAAMRSQGLPDSCLSGLEYT